jgi:hypothetical protein
LYAFWVYFAHLLRNQDGFTPNPTAKTPNDSFGVFRFKRLNALECLKGLPALQASMQGLAGRRTKGSDAFRVGAAALGTG